MNRTGVKPGAFDGEIYLNSWGAAFADYDLDGYADLVTTSRDVIREGFPLSPACPNCPNRNMIYRGGPDGLVSQTDNIVYSMTQCAQSVTAPAWGDVDGDGFPELIVSTCIFINHGNGTFSGGEGLLDLVGGLNQYISGVAFGDYDGDGYIDLVVASSSPTASTSLNVLRNTGLGFNASSFPLVRVTNGHLTTSVYRSSERWNSRHTLAFVDYDFDGHLDLSLGLAFATVPILFRNVGGGGFKPEAAGARARAVTAGDFDNDGDIDLFYTSGTLFENDGIGGWTQRSLPNTDAAEGAAFGDIDNDGLLELVIVGRSTGAGNVLLRYLGNGQFQEVAGDVANDASSHCKSVTFADYDGDGWLDLFIARASGSQWEGSTLVANHLYQNSGTGVLIKVTAGVIATDATSDSRLGVFGDIDNDGHLDLWVTSSRSNQHGAVGATAGVPAGPNTHNSHLGDLFRNQGSGQFLKDTTEEMATDITCNEGSNSLQWGCESHSAAFGDFDGDGWLDLAAEARGESRLYRNRGNGTFVKYFADLPGTAGWFNLGFGVTFADINNDGWLDIISNGGMWMNQNGGGFAASGMSSRSVYGFQTAWPSTCNSPQCLFVADIDNDGRLDILIANDHTGNYRSIIWRRQVCPAAGQSVPLSSTSASSACGLCPSFMIRSGENKCSECDRGVIRGPTGACSFNCPPGYVREYGESGCGEGCPPGTAYDAASRTCASCAPGSFTNFNGSVRCTECAPGSANPYFRQSACLACEAGKFSALSNASDCTECALGGYCPDAGASSALVFHQCPVGHYNEERGASSLNQCTACAPGSANPVPGSANATACIQCLPGSFTDSSGRGTCSLCAPGTYTPDSGSTACRNCTIGLLCTEGSSAPQPCPGGTHANQTALAAVGFLHSLSDCVTCPVGTFCSVGSAEPSDCAPGTYNDQLNASTCVNCAAGTFQAVARSTACDICTPGYYCAEGSAAPLPCPGGTHKNLTLTVMTSIEQCVICPVGTFCSIGSAEPSDCAPGTYNDQLNASTCGSCAAGTFQGAVRSTACEVCTPGFYCRAGAAAALPCPAGTTSNASLAVMTSDADCDACPAGTACSVGSEVALGCLPGSFSASARQGRCELCPAGQYQDEGSGTACKQCTRGFFCEAGTAKPTPCRAGTVSNATGVPDERLCVEVGQGFWAPLGSAVAENCPPSGFFCPGARDDALYGGAKPIIQATGGSTTTEEVAAVSVQVRIDASIDEYNESAVTLSLASLYDVSPALLSVTVASGSLQIDVSIATSAPSSEDAESSTWSEVLDIDVLLARVSSVPVAALSASMGAALGNSSLAVQVTPAAVTSIERIVRLWCPTGAWCTAGRIIACPINTYNNKTRQDFATACELCPTNSITVNDSSTSIDDCVCTVDYYDTIAGHGVSCSMCPVGTECDVASSIERLPLRASYFRLTNDTIDVRRCPDAEINCSTSFGTASCVSTSGCRGGESFGTSSCEGSLDGAFCRLCRPDAEGVLMHYVEATEEVLAHCEPCGDVLGRTAATVGIVVGGGGVVLTALVAVRWALSPRALHLFEHMMIAFTPQNKLKMLVGFYMITTKVDNVYDVSMPGDVRELLQRFQLVISFGLKGFAATPLACLGLGGYVPRLLFWMIVPWVAVASIVCFVMVERYSRRRHAAKKGGKLASAAPKKMITREATHGAGFSLNDDNDTPLVRARTRHNRHQTRSKTSVRAAPVAPADVSLLESLLPPFLRVMFLLYPLVTNVAFEGFPCYEFGDGRGWLIADVNIQCGTPDHDAAKTLAVVAVVLYPIGLWVLNLVLLWIASPAIISGRDTALSRSISFLYGEYDVTAFWWELAEMLRKFLLVGVFVVVEPGSILQISLGTIVCAVFLMVQLQAAPYISASDDYLACASSFSLTMLFFCSVIYKYTALTDNYDVWRKMSEEQKDDYDVPSVLLSVVLAASVFGSLVFAGVLAVVQVVIEARAEARLRRLKYVKNGHWVECKQLDDEQAYHLFLSHAWPAAQDRMRIVKARFLESLPSCRTFLDVDNLKSGSGTAEVDMSECILVFCTKAYFDKKNSMKELYRAVCQRRPILAMLEPDESQDGGLDQAAVTALLTDARIDKFKLRKKWGEWKDEGELLPEAFDHAPSGAEVAAALFATPAVEWNRLPHFQDVTIRLIAQNGVLHGTDGELYLQGEAACGKIKLAPPLKGRKYHLFCSPFNAGAAELAAELGGSDVFVTDGKRASVPLTYTTEAKELTSCDHMLVLLDSRTWTSGETTANFVEHIHEAMRLGVHLNCAHEFPSAVGPPRHECEFGLMFGDDWTPGHLTSGPTNLYKEIALALKGVEWRKPGLVALASKLVASTGPHAPMDFEVPSSYEPATGVSVHHQPTLMRTVTAAQGMARTLAAIKIQTAARAQQARQIAFLHKQQTQREELLASTNRAALKDRPARLVPAGAPAPSAALNAFERSVGIDLDGNGTIGGVPVPRTQVEPVETARNGLPDMITGMFALSTRHPVNNTNVDLSA